MVDKPPDEYKEMIIETMAEVPSPLVHGPSLYGELVEGKGMNYDLIQQSMAEMQMDDEVRWLCISPDNSDDIPASEYVYIPDEEQEIQDFID